MDPGFDRIRRGKARSVLVIRVHPREFPNKREGVLSDHAGLLRRRSRSCRTTPGQLAHGERIPLRSGHDHGRVRQRLVERRKGDVLLGIPVVLYSPQLVLYPPSLNYVGTTKMEYFSQIERALEDGWNVERSAGPIVGTPSNFVTRPSTSRTASPETSTRHSSSRCCAKSIKAVAPTMEQERMPAPRETPVGRRNDKRCDPWACRQWIWICRHPPFRSRRRRPCFGAKNSGWLVDGLYGSARNLQNNALADKLRAYATDSGHVD